ncbi:MAG: InlB B-repeat-containing protein [Bacillota bacterium]
MESRRYRLLVIMTVTLMIILMFSTFSFAATLTINEVDGSGEVTKDPEGPYNNGDEVTLETIPDSGYRFVEWQNNNGEELETINPYDHTMGADDEVIVAVYEEYTLDTSVDGSGGLTVDRSNYPEVVIEADADSGFEFSGWDGDVPTGAENQNPVTIDMTSDKSVTANFSKGRVSNFEIGPSYIVFNTGVREYDFRPEAISEDGVSEDVTMDFQFSTDAARVYVVDKETGDTVASAAAGKNENGVHYELANRRVILSNTILLSNLELGETFEVRLGDPNNGPELAEFTIKGAYARPRMDVSLKGHPQYGVLEDDRVYYVNQKDDLNVDITANSDLSNQQIVNSVTSTDPGFLGRDVSISKYTWPEIDGTSDIDDVVNGNLSEEWITDDYGDNENWEMNPEPFINELNSLPEGDTLQIMAVRMKAYALGALNYTDKNYYFAIDQTKPEIDSVKPGISTDELEGKDLDEQISLVDNNSADSPEPEIKIGFNEVLSGIDVENINARAIKVDDSRPLNDIVQDYKEDFDQTFDQDIDQRLRVIDYNQESNEATLFPYGNLQEGKYAVRVTVEDNAGNVNDQIASDAGITGFTFILQVNQDQPIINNISLRDDNGQETDSIISTSGGRLQFDVHNSQELRYQIRRRDQTGETWNYISDKELDNKTKFINRTFDDLGVTLEDGTYEVIMVADDIKLQEGVVDAIETIGPADGSDIETEVRTAIEAELDEQNLRLNDRRTEVRAFRFEVDGTAPQIGGVKYINPQSGEAEDPDDDGTFGILYTATPTFQVEITDRSQLGNLDIEIDDVLAGVTKQRVTKEDGKRVNKITFTPNTPLSDGEHSIKIDVEDKWGNPADEDGDSPYEKVFENVFETQNVAKGITFNINDGDRLSVKESSAIEVMLPTDKTLDKTSLEVKINDKLVVDGKSKAIGSQDFEVISFDDWDRFILFSVYPLPSGKNEISVTVDDQRGNTTGNSVGFMIDNYREGFGFGRLGKFMLEKAKKLEEAGD